MSASEPVCQFYPSSHGYDAEGFTCQRQFISKDKQIEVSSNVECQPLKKQRISVTLPNHGVQVMTPNRASNLNFKTQLCRNFRMGRCNLGFRCKYAHNIGELRRKWIDDSLAGRTSSGNFRQEPKLCRTFLQGNKCAYNSNCRFLHMRPGNGRESRMVTVNDTGPTGYCKNEYGQLALKKDFNVVFDAEVNQKRLQLKKNLCINWGIKGECRYGKLCRFAHGQAEAEKLDGYYRCRVMQTSATNAANSTTEACISHKEEANGMKCNFKINELEKNVRIYGDWIEDDHHGIA